MIQLSLKYIFSGDFHVLQGKLLVNEKEWITDFLVTIGTQFYPEFDTLHCIELRGIPVSCKVILSCRIREQKFDAISDEQFSFNKQNNLNF